VCVRVLVATCTSVFGCVRVVVLVLRTPLIRAPAWAAVRRRTVANFADPYFVRLDRRGDWPLGSDVGVVRERVADSWNRCCPAGFFSCWQLLFSVARRLRLPGGPGCAPGGAPCI